MTGNIISTAASRRGITMVEVVIALVIISIISAAALSVVLISVDVEQKSMTYIEVENASENVLACFRYSTDEAEFLTALQKTGPYEQTAGGNIELYASGYRLFIHADFEQERLTFTAMDTKAETILHYVYPNDQQAGGGAG